MSARTALVLSRYDRSGASSRVRFYQYESALAQCGWQLDIAPLFDKRVISTIGKRRGLGDRLAIFASYARRVAALLRQGRPDIVWIEKELFPYLPGFLEPLLLRSGVPYVVDFDDAIFHNYDLNSRGIVRRLLSGKLDRLLAGSSLVTAGNGYLADYATRHGAGRVEIMPSTVDTSRYPELPYPPPGPVRVGWVGGRTTTRYLADLLPVLEDAAGSVPLKLVTIGANTLTSDRLEIEQHDWSLEREGELLAGCHLGIMPLDDTPWERGKCAFKLIQYMAAGRPVIASPVGANCDVVTEQTGRFAASAGEWQAHLADCAANPEKWRAMGEAGRERAVSRYSISAVAPRIAHAFDEVLAAVRS